MNYDGDDELERMRQRRQMRRESRQDPDRFGYEDSRYGEAPTREEAGRAGRRRPQEAADRAREEPENGRSAG